MTTAATGNLTWGLVISTYKREEVLPRCLRLALAQTRRPVELIVVDASPDWEKNRELVLKECAGLLPPRWFYEQAQRKSIAAQRNQGLKLATTDVVFMIDDDSLLYPDCAEHVMKVYEADTGARSSASVPFAWIEPRRARRNRSPSQPVKPKKWWIRFGERLYDVADRFVPYDGQYPQHVIPPEVTALNVVPMELLVGFKMTFRRAAVMKEGFSDILDGYSAAEDLDASYRISCHGALVQNFDAKLCHLAAQGGRITRFTKSALCCLNVGVLLAIHGTKAPGPRWRYRRMLVKRLLLDFMGDVMRSRWTLPQARGVCLAMRYARTIFVMSPAELRSWYPEFQQKLLAQDGQRR